MSDPKTREQWQEAVNLADIWLHLDSARAYGLIDGGPEVDVERCKEIIQMGKERRIHANWSTEQVLGVIGFVNDSVTEGLERMEAASEKIEVGLALAQSWISQRKGGEDNAG